MKAIDILNHHYSLKNCTFLPFLLDLSNEELLKLLIHKYGDLAWDLYNFTLVVKNFHNAFDGSYTLLGAKVYDKMSSDLLRNYIDLRIFQLCIEEEINEEFGLIYNLKGDSFTFKVNLERVMNRDIVSILNINIEGLLPRTKNAKLKNKIISMNLIYGVFYRFKHIIFFNKKTKVVDQIVSPGVAPEHSYWDKKILYTKGYVLIFPNSCVKILLGLVYRRKIVKLLPLEIRYIGKKNTVVESLKNENYSHPIWMKNLNISDFKGLDKSEVVNFILEEEFDANKMLKNLNFLNRIKLFPNMEFFNIVEKISLSSPMLDKEYITKDRLEEGLLKAEEGVVYLDKEELMNIPHERLNCLTFVNLIKIQYERFKSFFLEFRRDGRVRIYNYNYPINFQLSHLVRNTINIEKNTNNDISIVKNFLNLSIWGELGITPLEISTFFWQKISIETLNKISKKFKINLIDEGTEEEKILGNLEMEGILTILESFAPKKIIPLENRVKWTLLNALDALLSLDMENIKEIEEVMGLLGVGKKKLHVIKNIYTLKKIHKDRDQSDIFWVDASSNGIQLITLRLGKFNDLLLQLTNIIDNKTDCRNIYSYVTKELGKIDHSEFIRDSLKGKISGEELNLMYNDDDNKDRIMPGSYGKGKIRSREDMADYITKENREIWSRLSEEEKIALSDYIWVNVFRILSEIGFDLNFYKKACRNFIGDEEKVICWYNDCGFPIIPIQEKKSKRDALLREMELLKLKRKELKNKDFIESSSKVLNKVIEIEESLLKIDLDEVNINKKLAWDENKFYKRTRIRTDDSFISPRIKHTELEINRVKTVNGVAPNSTHAYDGSNMDKTLDILAELGMKALPIFDSLGGSIKQVSLVKIAFKIANIINIENNYKKSVFPHIEISMERGKRVELYKKILESSYFIR